MSDKLGRKISFFASVVVMAVFGVLSGVVNNYWAFIILRCIVGNHYVYSTDWFGYI